MTVAKFIRMIPTRFVPTLCLLLALTDATLHASSVSDSSPLFRDKDRWAVIGDSITQSGPWHSWIYAYYATRFPNQLIEPVNCGISGDTAAGAIERYAWDIHPRHATVATILFGANDVSRSLYEDPSPSPDILQRRANAFARYQDNIKKLVALLKSDGTRVILVTPTPYDETATLPMRNNLHGVNDALAEFSGFLKRFGSEHEMPVIDLHDPMTALNRDLQKRDPSLTLIGADRLHPARAGSLVMAWLFLKAQGAPATVSHVAIDVSMAKVLRAENATVNEVRLMDKLISFTQLSNSLPYPVDSYSRQALDWIPFHEDLNQETLRVSGLEAGIWQLRIDQTDIVRYSSEELAAGVNLALQPTTPQNQQAQRVLSLIKEWREKMTIERTIANTEHWRMRKLERPISFETAKPIVEEALARLKEPGVFKPEYHLKVYTAYLKEKPNEAQNRAILETLPSRIQYSATPMKNRYELRWVAPSP